MKFTERKDWQYDPDIFTLHDTQTALSIQAEFVRRHSPNRPLPTFMEVDRRSAQIDALWHVPLNDRTVFSRVFQMPVLVNKERPDWRLTRVGLVPLQKHKITMANLILQEMDWFPLRGDMMFFGGYRHMIINVVLEPEAFWQQTNVWLGLQCETVIPADGDARPVLNQAVAVPRELIQTFPIPEV